MPSNGRLRITSAAFGVLVALGLPGCVDAQACPSLPERATVKAVHGSDLEVTRYPDGAAAVLHAANAQLLRRDPDGCVAIGVADVTVGSTVSFDVDAWAESSPVQGWPKQVVVG